MRIVFARRGSLALAIATAIIAAGTLAACSGTTSSTINPTLAQDAAECGIALALAGVMSGGIGIPAAIAATPACLRLPADMLVQIEGTATTQAVAARRAMRIR